MQSDISLHFFPSMFSLLCLKNLRKTTFEPIPSRSVSLSEYSFNVNGTTLTVTGSGALDSKINLEIQNQNITDIIIEEGITDIDNDTFVDCSTIQSISLPNTLISIGSNCFVNLQQLNEITLPSQLKSIGSKSFINLVINSIEIPASVTEIGTQTFHDSQGFAVAVNEGNTAFVLDQGVLYTSDKKTLITSTNPNLESLTIAEGVETISDYSFYQYKIKQVTFPGTLKTIGYAAFQETQLTSLDLKQVENIDFYAFCSCSQIESITFSPKLTEIKNYTFKSNNVMETLTIPGNVTIIHEGAFSEYSKLTSLTLSEGVTRIGHYSFANAGALSQLSLPESLTFMATAAFSDCKQLINVTIPGKLSEINEYLFFGCTELTNINLNNIKTIGANAFRGCKKLNNLNLSSVETIGREAFTYCESIESLVLPSSLTSIGPLAFYGLKSLKSISVDEKNANFKSVDSVLYNKEMTQLILFPAQLNKTQFTTDETVTTLKAGSLSFLKYLETITLSQSVSSIENITFSYTESLKDINYCGNTQFIGFLIYESPNVTVNVPTSSTLNAFNYTQTKQVDGICPAPKSNLGLIIGLSIAGAVLVIAIIIVIICCLKKKKSDKSTNEMQPLM